MKYRLTLISILIALCANAQAPLFNSLENNIKSFYDISYNRRDELQRVVSDLGADAKSLQTGKPFEVTGPESVDKLISLFKPNGTWSDIDYNNNLMSGFDQARHAKRTLFLSVVYQHRGSKYYHSQEVSRVIHRAMQYWFDTMPVCVNWWYNEIGIPNQLGPAFIFMKSELSPKEMEGALAVMNKSSFKQTGQNKVWQAGNVLFKAVLIRDAKLAVRARDTIFSELHTSREEGMQPDFSFHQHGPQQQMGNYGMSFLGSMTFWSRTLAGTSLAIAPAKVQLLRDLLADGFDWLSWKGYFDVNSLGRQFFPGAEKNRSLTWAYSVLDMILIDPAHRNDYLSVLKANYAESQTTALPLGTRHFWCSDFTVHRSPQWYSTIKMSSNRTQATETGNSENLKGYHVGDGTTFIEVDGNEYDEIFPCWDWKKLPGVTATQPDEPLPQLKWEGYHNTGDFTGGLTDGKDGITAFRLNRDSLTANKSWFYLDDRMVCLGSDIQYRVKGMPVSTTINQANLIGDVIYNGQQDTKLATGNSYSSSDLKWVFHDKIGYYFLKPESVTASAKTQSGRWHDIEAADGRPEAISKDIFTLEIKHNLDAGPGSYAYVILPAVTLSQVETFKPDFEVISNDNKAQAIIKNDRSGLWLTAYQPTEVTANNFPSVAVKQAGLYLLKKIRSHWRLSVSDPTQKLKYMELTVNGKVINITLPQGNEAGKTTIRDLD